VLGGYYFRGAGEAYPPPKAYPPTRRNAGLLIHPGFMDGASTGRGMLEIAHSSMAAWALFFGSDSTSTAGNFTPPGVLSDLFREWAFFCGYRHKSLSRSQWLWKSKKKSWKKDQTASTFQDGPSSGDSPISHLSLPLMSAEPWFIQWIQKQVLDTLTRKQSLVRTKSLAPNTTHPSRPLTVRVFKVKKMVF